MYFVWVFILACTYLLFTIVNHHPLFILCLNCPYTWMIFVCAYYVIFADASYINGLFQFWCHMYEIVIENLTDLSCITYYWVTFKQHHLLIMASGFISHVWFHCLPDIFRIFTLTSITKILGNWFFFNDITLVRCTQSCIRLALFRICKFVFSTWLWYS